MNAHSLRSHAGLGLPCSICGPRCVVDDVRPKLFQVVGVDPGPIPGVALLDVAGGRLTGRSVFQTDPGSIAWLIRRLLTEGQPASRVLAVERFVVGARSARLSTSGAAAATRDMVGSVVELAGGLMDVRVIQRCAGEVMPWASDKRLLAVGLFDATRGMQHARAACRHALFSAVRDCGLTDPLSAKVRGT